MFGYTVEFYPLYICFLFHFPACKYTNCFTSNGSLTSANYPNNFDPITADSWLITAPAGKTVTINFLDFILDGGNNCKPTEDDTVTLYYDGSASDPRIGRNESYCFRESPGCLETTSNYMLVTFTSNNDYNNNKFRGFSAKFYLGG